MSDLASKSSSFGQDIPGTSGTQMPGHQPWDVPHRNSMQGASFACSRDIGVVHMHMGLLKRSM